MEKHPSSDPDALVTDADRLVHHTAEIARVQADCSECYAGCKQCDRNGKTDFATGLCIFRRESADVRCATGI